MNSSAPLTSVAVIIIIFIIRNKIWNYRESSKFYFIAISLGWMVGRSRVLKLAQHTLNQDNAAMATTKKVSVIAENKRRTTSFDIKTGRAHDLRQQFLLCIWCEGRQS